MSDIQRYALQTELSEDSLGKWVRYEDHLDEVAWAVSEVLEAARDAVLGTRPQDHPYPECDCPYCCDVALAIAAIDAYLPPDEHNRVLASIDALKEDNHG